MAVSINGKNRAAVVLGRQGGKKGGPARAAKLTPEQRSESARNAVQARWAKAKGRRFTPATPAIGASKTALHLCLKRIKAATNQNELRRLTEELQKIVFHTQYRNAEN
jgi:hypothetical protein